MQDEIDRIEARLGHWYWRLWYRLFPIHIKVSAGVYDETLTIPSKWKDMRWRFEGCTFADGLKIEGRFEGCTFVDELAEEG